MPNLNDLSISLVITTLLHMGLPDSFGRGCVHFLSLFVDDTPPPVLYLAYGLSLYLSVFLACHLGRVKLLGYPDARRNARRRRPHRKAQALARHPRHAPGATTEERRPAPQPAFNARDMKLRIKTCASRGEQARRLRAAREGQTMLRCPDYRYWSAFDPCAHIRPVFTIPEHFKPAPEEVSAKPHLDEVSTQPVPEAGSPSPEPEKVSPQPRTIPVPRHKFRIASAPGPHLPSLNSPVYAFTAEFRRARQWEAAKEKRRAELARKANNENAIAQPPVKEVQTFKDVQTVKEVQVVKPVQAVKEVEPAPKPQEETNSLSVLPESESEALTVVPEPESISILPEPVKQASVSPKFKARIEKIKLLKKRAHAVRERQTKTLSLLDPNVRRTKKDEGSPERKRRSALGARFFLDKVVLPVYEPMDVDMHDAEDSMDVDVPDPVDELCVRFAKLF